MLLAQMITSHGDFRPASAHALPKRMLALISESFQDTKPANNPPGKID